MVKQGQAQRPTARSNDYPPTAPAPVPHPATLHRWSELSLLHWAYDPKDIQALLPEGLTVDVFEGAAWVGLVPFHCTIHPPALPRIPWVSSFEEMNVRTYVRGPDGAPGVWFITLDAARLGAVIMARVRYGLTYFWSKMQFSRVGGVVTYSSRRRWLKPRRAVGTVALEIGAPIDPAEMTPLDAFLTGRWTFFGRVNRHLYRGEIEHDAWRLEKARCLHCDPGLLCACGLPAPVGEPVVHHARPVNVRMSKRMPLLAA